MKIMISHLGLCFLLAGSNAYAACTTNSGAITTTLTSSGGGACENGSAGTITTDGSSEHGIVSTDADSTNTNSGMITTDGSNANGIRSFGNYSTITNSGMIATDGEDGIRSFGNYSTITNSGMIATDGEDGIRSFGNYSTITNSGIITTTDDESDGINSSGNYSTITNSGIITITDEGEGIRSSGNYSTITNSGIITTTNEGVGIYSSGNYSTITNAGTIITRGDNANSHGILSRGANSTISNSGTIRATGDGNVAIYLYNTTNNTVNLNRGSVIVGDIFANLLTTSAQLNLNLGAGASYAYQVTGNAWTVADLNQRPMVAGSAYAAGVGNITTAAQSLYERTSQMTQSLDGRIRAHHQQNSDAPYWLTTYYSDAQRGGEGLSGANLNFNQYRSGITAGFNISNPVTPMELVLNYEHSQLNIDSGNQAIDTNAVMAGVLLPNISQVLGGTLGAKALIGYSDFDGDRKVLDNTEESGSRNVTASYHATNINLGAAWNKTLHQTDTVTLDTLIGLDLNTQRINAYSESDLFKWDARTLNQLQGRAELGLEIKPLANPLTLFGRVGIAYRDLLGGEKQHYAINDTAVSYKDANQHNTYRTVRAGARYPLTATIQAYAQINYYDSSQDIDALSGGIGITGQF